MTNVLTRPLFLQHGSAATLAIDGGPVGDVMPTSAAPAVSLTLLGLGLYMTLEYLRPEVVFPSAADVGILRYLSLILAIAFLVKRITSPQDWVRAPQHLFITIFLFVVPVSLLLGGVKDSTWYARTAFLDFGKIVVMYFVCVGTINSRARLTMFITLVQVLTVYLAVGGISAGAFGIFLPGFGIESSGRLRYAGIFADSNDFAQLLLVGGAMILNRMIWAARGLGKILWLLAAVLVAAAITLTASRGGVLGMVILTMVAVARRRGPLKATFLSIVLVAALVGAMPNLALQRLRGTSIEEGSAHGRIEAWTQGWYMFWSHPLTGVGYGEFREYARMTAHNSLVLVASETGFVGAYCWLAFFYMTFRLNSRLKNAGAVTSDYCLHATYDALVAYLSTAWFLSRAYIFLPYFLVALGVSAVIVAAKERRLPLAMFSALTPTDLVRIGAMALAWLFVWKLNLVAGWSL